jgi:hypothetical protein
MDLIRLAQYEAFGFNMMHYAATGNWQKGSTVLSLNAYLDLDGILRSGSRARNQHWAPEVTRKPIIMPRDHRVTLLLARNYTDFKATAHHQTHSQSKCKHCTGSKAYEH